MKAAPGAGGVKGATAALLAPLFIALSIMLTKLAGHLAHPLVVAGVGSLVSVPLLLAGSMVARSKLDLHGLLTEMRAPFLKSVVSRAILGQALIVSGFILTTGVKAVLLLRLEPLFVVGWAWLLHKENPSTAKLLLLALLIVGSALVVAPNGIAAAGPCLGDALVVAALLFLSYSYMPTAEVMKSANPTAVSLLSNLLGGVAILAVAAFTCRFDAFVLSPKAFALISIYALVFFVVALNLYFYAFKTFKPWAIASFLSLEVVFGLILACLLLGETVAPLQLVGAAVILGATLGIGKLLQIESRAA